MLSLNLDEIVGNVNYKEPNLNLDAIVGNIFHTEEAQSAEDANKLASSVETMKTIFGNTRNSTQNSSSSYQNLLDTSGVSTSKSNIANPSELLKASSNGNKPIFSFSSPKSNNSSSGNYNNGGFKVGMISAKYEAGGYNGGIVSGGQDYGGVSYGIPQFSTKAGSADTFVSWLKQNHPEIGNYFGNYKAGTTEFTNAWKKAYADFGDTFSDIQVSYAYDNIAMPLAKLAKEKTGIDYTRSPALQELVYTTALQFGPGSLGLSALGNVTSDMSDADIINASFDKKIANYKSYFKSSSTSIQEAAKNRFANERNDILGLIGYSTATSSGTSDFSGSVGKRIANTASYNNDAAKGQCVWYVRGRAKEKLGKDTGAIGNANEMYYGAKASARLAPTVENIKPNTILSYQYGSGSLGQKYGHVIFIEDVVGDTVYYTEGGSGYYKNGTDGVVKTGTRQQILSGVNSAGARIGSNAIGLIDLSKY